VDRTLLVEIASDCSPETFVGLGAGLLDRMRSDPRPRLLLAGLSGEAILLGRHQRAASALDRQSWEKSGLPVYRRPGGGRALLAGEGRLGLYLALPRPDAILDSPIPTDRVINRHVRGLLAGLVRAGAASGAHYFGRDFVSSESRQLARLSQDGLPEGPVLFEAVVAVTESLELPAALRGYPVHSDPRADGPPPVTLDELWKEPRPLSAVMEAIVAGYERTYGLRAEPASDATPAADFGPPVWEDEEGFETSGVADIPIGFAEALLRHADDRVVEVRFRGDFIAPAFVVRALEQELVGLPLAFASLGERVDGIFRREGAGILGVRGLRIFPDAILAAAGKH